MNNNRLAGTINKSTKVTLVCQLTSQALSLSHPACLLPALLLFSSPLSPLLSPTPSPPTLIPLPIPLPCFIVTPAGILIYDMRLLLVIYILDNLSSLIISSLSLFLLPVSPFQPLHLPHCLSKPSSQHPLPTFSIVSKHTNRRPQLVFRTRTLITLADHK